jgi:membrane associated rhomboid family serine protease
MFIPLHDSTPLKVIRFQAVTITIIAIEVAVYLLTGAFATEASLAATATLWGVVPGEITGTMPPVLGYDPVPEPFTLISYQFLHGGWWHLISNMLFLWVFADNIEDAYGHVSFALLYLFCGVVAALAHVLVMPYSGTPLVGASGAVSGVLGAYLVLFPKARVWVLLAARIPLRIGAVGAGRLVRATGLLLVDDAQYRQRHRLGRAYRRLYRGGGDHLCHPPKVVDAARRMNASYSAPKRRWWN